MQNWNLPKKKPSNCSTPCGRRITLGCRTTALDAGPMDSGKVWFGVSAPAGQTPSINIETITRNQMSVDRMGSV